MDEHLCFPELLEECTTCGEPLYLVEFELVDEIEALCLNPDCKNGNILF